MYLAAHSARDREDGHCDQDRGTGQYVVASACGDAHGPYEPDAARGREPLDVSAVADDRTRSEEPDPSDDPLNDARGIDDRGVDGQRRGHFPRETERGQSEARGTQRHHHVRAKPGWLGLPLPFEAEGAAQDGRSQEPQDYLEWRQHERQRCVGRHRGL